MNPDFTPQKSALRCTDTHPREAALSVLFCLPSEKGSSLKEKNLLPPGANSFLLNKTFSKGVWCTKK